MKFCMYNVTTAIKIGGIETFYWEVARELKNKKYEVELISGKGNFIVYNDIFLKQFDFTSRDKILDLGHRFRKWGERVSFFKNAYSYLKNQKYDYLLIHKPLDFFVAYFMKRTNPNLKVIFISGGEDFYGFDKFFSKYVDFMFAVSRDNAKIIQKRYNRNVKVLHNGVNTKLFRFDKEERDKFRKKYNLENKKVLISIGRIVGWKGYQLVIEALQEMKDLHYILIGEGEYIDTLKNLVKEYKLENRVLFLGAIENKSLYKYLSMSDVFVQPSIGHEAFGITIVEAMACGLPVVASRNGGIVDIVKEGENGFMFEINNIVDMKQKLKLTFDNLEFLLKNCRIYVDDNFTWNKTVNKLLEEIK